MVVTVRYVFGVGRGSGDAVTLEVGERATVFEVLQRLGVSCLELHAAVNGTSATDATVLQDGDEVALIPAIQGGCDRAPLPPVGGEGGWGVAGGPE
jgi:molybdopterin converting factor small subunit